MFKDNFLLIILFVVVAATAIAQRASAQPSQTVVYVDASSNNITAPSASNPGSTWTGTGTSAYKYLQHGLARALQLVPSDSNRIQVWVADGVYRPDFGGGISAGDRNATLRLLNFVRIAGGFLATSLPLVSTCATPSPTSRSSRATCSMMMSLAILRPLMTTRTTSSPPSR